MSREMQREREYDLPIYTPHHSQSGDTIDAGTQKQTLLLGLDYVRPFVMNDWAS